MGAAGAVQGAARPDGAFVFFAIVIAYRFVDQEHTHTIESSHRRYVYVSIM